MANIASWWNYTSSNKNKFLPYQGTPHWKKENFHYYPTPGCELHIIDKRKRRILFDRFCNRPRSAIRLYWNTHPKEYIQVLKECLE